MKKGITILPVMVFFFMLFGLFYSFAEETLTLTAYYPAPYGIYDELQTNTLKITGPRGAPTSLPMGVNVEVGGNTPLLNFDVNFRSQPLNSAFLGAAFRIDTRDPASPLFNWLYRPAGSAQGVNESVIMALTKEGRVGIGITDLSSVRLHNTALHSFVAGEAQLQVSNNDAASAYSDTLILRRAGQPDTHEHGILFADFNSMQAAIRAKRRYGPADYNSSLLFFTQKTGLDTFHDDATARMVIDYNGNVGIGTTNPLAGLHVRLASAGAGQKALILESSTGAYPVYFTPQSGESSYNPLSQSNDAGIFYGSVINPNVGFVIGPWSDELKGIRIIPSGNVGIGTAFPQAKLQVDGSVKITGGNPGANKVLTSSDATGLASWQNSGWPPGAYCILKNEDGPCPAPFIQTSWMYDSNAGRDAGGFTVKFEALGSRCDNCPEADWRPDVPSYSRLRSCCKKQ